METILRLDKADENIEKVCNHPVFGDYIVAGRDFKRRDVVGVYKGKVMDRKGANRQEAKYEKLKYKCDYMIQVKINEKTYFVDAQEDDGRLLRLTAHSSTPNVAGKGVFIGGKLYIYFYALEDINRGDTIYLDYNDNREITKANEDFDWLTKKRKREGDDKGEDGEAKRRRMEEG